MCEVRATVEEREGQEVEMLRITEVEQSTKEVVLKVEGWVSGKSVRLLEDEGERYLGHTGRLVLNLTGVQFIDDAGIALLKRWSGERLVLRDGSSFVRMLLEEYGLVGSGTLCDHA